MTDCSGDLPVTHRYLTVVNTAAHGTPLRPLRTRRSRTTPPLPPLALDALLAIAFGECHGTAIADAINGRHAHKVTLGAVYSVVRLLETDRLIEWCPCRVGNVDTRTRCFSLTLHGRERLRAEARRLKTVLAMTKKLGVVEREQHSGSGSGRRRPAAR